jgi:hypothetical protein
MPAEDFINEGAYGGTLRGFLYLFLNTLLHGWANVGNDLRQFGGHLLPPVMPYYAISCPNMQGLSPVDSKYISLVGRPLLERDV